MAHLDEAGESREPLSEDRFTSYHYRCKVSEKGRDRPWVLKCKTLEEARRIAKRLDTEAVTLPNGHRIKPSEVESVVVESAGGILIRPKPLVVRPKDALV